MLIMLRSRSAGQAAMAGKLARKKTLIRKGRIGLEGLQRGAEIALDALQRGKVVGCEPDHDHRGGIGGARKSEAVSILHPLSLIHISEPTRLLSTSYAVFC